VATTTKKPRQLKNSGGGDAPNFKRGRTKTITIPYKPYEHQKEIHRLMDENRFTVVVAARRSGKTVAAINHLIARALSASDGRSRYAYVAPTYRQAKRIAWDYVKEFSRVVPLIKFHEGELRADLPNGSRIQLYGIDNPDSIRGQYFDSVVLDEYGNFPVGAFDKVIRPALADREGSCMFSGTPNGKANDFFAKWEHAGEGHDNWARYQINWQDAATLKDSEVEAMKKTMTEEEFAQELLATFTTAVRGAYYADQMNKSETEGRITTVPYDVKLPVHTFWDLGMSDSTAIIFAQFAGQEIRVIDYIEENGKGLDYFIRVLGEYQYIYGEHWGPFDLKVREMSSGMSRVEIAQELGLHFNIVPKMPVQDGINAVRSIMNRVWIDRTNCQELLSALYEYHREYDDKKGIFRQKAVHDHSSHGADAMRYLATSVDMVTNAAGIIAGTKRPKIFTALSGQILH
jgi:hypothetical protein